MLKKKLINSRKEKTLGLNKDILQLQMSLRIVLKDEESKDGYYTKENE